MSTPGHVRNGALVALGVAGLGAAATGGWFFSVYSQTVYWNLGDNTHAWYYVFPALYATTAATAIAAIIAGARVGAPDRRSSRWLAWGLTGLILLSLCACAATAMARAYPA